MSTEYTVNTAESYPIHIYMGSREHYNGPEFTKRDLLLVIGDFQRGRGLEGAAPVRISPTTYVFDDYIEDGWAISLINYPRTTRTKDWLFGFAFDLAVHLLGHFKQNRISIEDPDETTLLTSGSAQEKHK